MSAFILFDFILTTRLVYGNRSSSASTHFIDKTQKEKSLGGTILDFLFMNACMVFDFRSPMKGQFLAVDLR